MCSWEMFSRILKAKPEQLKDIRAAIESKYGVTDSKPLVSVLEKWKKERDI